MTYDPKKELEVLKRIRPNAVYSAQTRKNIILSAKKDFGQERAPSFFFMHRLAISSTTFALLVLLVGGYFGFQQYSGSRWSALNPAALRAEADAVESQVRIAEVKYQEAVVAKKAPLQKMAAPSAQPEVAATAPTDTVSIASDTMSIDEALDILTQ